jgi:hypothetical protein
VPPPLRCLRYWSEVEHRARGCAMNWESTEKKGLVPALFSEKIFSFRMNV